MFYIYKITNLINNKIYIGQTNNPSLRWSQHKSNAKNKNNQLIAKAIKKYGILSFSFEVIATCITKQNIDFLEQYIIQQYDSLNPNKGYNIDIGGSTYIRTPIIKDKISKSLRKYYQNNNGWLKGKHLNQEWKNNISKASRGKKGTNLGKIFPKSWSLAISKAKLNKPQPNLRRFSIQQEQKICQLYENNSAFSLGKQFNCSINTILNIIRRNNIPIKKNQYRLFSPQQEQIIYQKYKSGEKQKNLSVQFNCSISTIKNIIAKYKVLAEEFYE